MSNSKMASTLGKRKRHGREAVQAARAASEDSSESHNEDIQDVFRRHFEAHFKPLPVAQKVANAVENVPDAVDVDDTEWEGISEPEEGGRIEVIEHTATQIPSKMSKDDLKAFMSAKPPIDTTIASPISKSTPSTTKNESNDSANLKKDLALQRLLAESHLLDSPSSSTGISGTNRHKATDLRLQSLGAKTSILKQEKMPMSHRKGIILKQSEREEKRRREARENGIILEKVKRNTRDQKEGKRVRGIGGPGVGKFSGGTLRLSKKDIFDIEGPGEKFASRGRRGKGRGGGSKRGSR